MSELRLRLFRRNRGSWEILDEHLCQGEKNGLNLTH
jgi:hypothetical protein